MLLNIIKMSLDVSEIGHEISDPNLLVWPFSSHVLSSISQPVNSVGEVGLNGGHRQKVACWGSCY